MVSRFLILLLLVPLNGLADDLIPLSDLASGREVLSVDDLMAVEDIELSHEYDNPILYEDSTDKDGFKAQASRDASINSCNKSSKENVICANIMCDFGLLLGEWSDECTDWKLKLALLKASTPPWKSLPRCVTVDSSCKNQGLGHASSLDEAQCLKFSDIEKRHTCLLALELDDKDRASDFVERHDTDVQSLEALEFDDSESIEVDPDFLIDHVDARFIDAQELYKPFTYYGYDRDVTFIPAAYLSYYLRHRDDPGMVYTVKSVLIKSGVMPSVCSSVAYDQFYNCTQFPDLSPECWSERNHEAIFYCERRI